MMVKKTAISLTIVMILMMSLAMPVSAAEESGIVCTVTPGGVLVSVSVTPTSVAYGTVSLSSNSTSVEITATNDGNDVEDFQIKGSDATGAGGNVTWTLSDTAVGANQYMHEFATPTYPASGNHGGWSPLTTSYQTLVTDVSVSGSQAFKMQIWPPTSTTGYGERSTTVTILAIAGT